LRLSAPHAHDTLVRGAGKLPCRHVVLLAKRDPVSVEQVNLLLVGREADHFSDTCSAWPS
jgi:hypothetical protein